MIDPTIIERAILNNLAPRQNGMVPLTALWGDTLLDVPGVSYTAFKTALTSLQVKGQALIIEGEDRKSAKITDAGRGRITE